jgi:hypothetical protein
MAVLLAAAVAACGGNDTTNAAATTDDGSFGSALGDGSPQPGGQCDATKIRDAIVSNFTANAVPTQGRHGRRWADLGLVYDANDDGALDETEQQAIVDDFAAGCTAIQAQMLSKWDTDQDGTLSESELAAAKAAHEAEEAARDAANGTRPPGADGDGDHHGGGRHDGHGGDGKRHGGHDGDRGRGDHGRGDHDGDDDHGRGDHDGDDDHGRGDHATGPSPLLKEFDANADGSLDAAEKATMRTTVRARIAAGERPFAKPATPVDGTDTTTTGGDGTDTTTASDGTDTTTQGQ